MLPEAVDPDDRAVDEEVGRPAEEGDATLPEVLPVPESLAEARRNELERWRFDSAKCMDITCESPLPSTAPACIRSIELR